MRPAGLTALPGGINTRGTGLGDKLMVAAPMQGTALLREIHLEIYGMLRPAEVLSVTRVPPPHLPTVSGQSAGLEISTDQSMAMP